MKCANCNRKGKYKIPSLEKLACSTCFNAIIEKRFSRTLKKYYPNIKELNIELKRPSDKILLYLLEKKAKKAINLKIKKGKKIMSQHTLDDLSVSVIQSFITGKNMIIQEHSLLEEISETELKDYAIINKLSFRKNPRKGKDKLAHDLIKKIEKRRPGVMYSIKSYKDKIYT